MQNVIFFIKSHLKKMLLKIKKKKNHNIRLVNLKYWLKNPQNITTHYKFETYRHSHFVMKWIKIWFLSFYHLSSRYTLNDAWSMDDKRTKATQVVAECKRYLLPIGDIYCKNELEMSKICTWIYETLKGFYHCWLICTCIHVRSHLLVSLRIFNENKPV